MKYLSFLPSFFSRLANKKTFSLRDLRGDGCPQTTAVVPGRSTAPYGGREDLWGFGHGTFRPASLGCGPRAFDVKWRKSEVAWLESSYTVPWQVLWPCNKYVCYTVYSIHGVYCICFGFVLVIACQGQKPMKCSRFLVFAHIFDSSRELFFNLGRVWLMLRNSPGGLIPELLLQMSS